MKFQIQIRTDDLHFLEIFSQFVDDIGMLPVKNFFPITLGIFASQESVGVGQRTSEISQPEITRNNQKTSNNLGYRFRHKHDALLKFYGCL